MNQYIYVSKVATAKHFVCLKTNKRFKWAFVRSSHASPHKAYARVRPATTKNRFFYLVTVRDLCSKRITSRVLFVFRIIFQREKKTWTNCLHCWRRALTFGNELCLREWPLFVPTLYLSFGSLTNFPLTVSHSLSLIWEKKNEWTCYEWIVF